MADTPLMPKATAVWLVENTSLTFEQIADFCGLHMLEVKGIADGDVAQGIRGMDPIASNQLQREEIEKGQKDPKYRLKLKKSSVVIPSNRKKQRKRPKYVPVSKRQDRPNAIIWLLRNHPELKDAQIIRLVGTTKPTIEKIRERTHANISSFQPVDPVALGLCSQADLDAEVARASKRAGAAREQAGDAGETLLPTEQTTAASNPFDQPQTPISPAPAPSSSESSGLTSAEEAKKAADSLFGKLTGGADEGDGSDKQEEG